MKNFQILLILCTACFAHPAFSQKKTTPSETQPTNIPTPKPPIMAMPDLIVKSATGFRMINNNTQIEYTYTIENIGSAGTGKKTGLQTYWSKDDTFDPDDVPDGGGSLNPMGPKGQFSQKIFTGVQTDNPLFKGMSMYQVVNEYPYLVFQIDADKQISEYNENNNVLVVKHGLTSLANDPQPDQEPNDPFYEGLNFGNVFAARFLMADDIGGNGIEWTDDLKVGTIYYFQTNGGNYGKMQILENGPEYRLRFKTYSVGGNWVAWNRNKNIKYGNGKANLDNNEGAYDHGSEDIIWYNHPEMKNAATNKMGIHYLHVLNGARMWRMP